MAKKVVATLKTGDSKQYTKVINITPHCALEEGQTQTL